MAARSFGPHPSAGCLTPRPKSIYDLKLFYGDNAHQPAVESCRGRVTAMRGYRRIGIPVSSGPMRERYAAISTGNPAGWRDLLRTIRGPREHATRTGCPSELGWSRQRSLGMLYHKPGANRNDRALRTLAWPAVVSEGLGDHFRASHIRPFGRRSTMSMGSLISLMQSALLWMVAR